MNDDYNEYKRLYLTLKKILTENAIVRDYIEKLLNNSNKCSDVELKLVDKLLISDLKYYKCPQQLFNGDDIVANGASGDIYKVNADRAAIIIKKQPFFYISNIAKWAKNYDDIKNELTSSLHDIQNPAIRDLVFCKKMSNMSNNIPHFPILYKYFVADDVANKFDRRNMINIIQNIILEQYNINYDYTNVEHILSKTPQLPIEQKIHEIFNLYKLHEKKHLYLVMEKLDDTLENYFDFNATNIKELLLIILQVFMALYYLKNNYNNQGIKNYVHCDLHLLNVMYKREDRIIDYDYNGNYFKLHTNFVLKIIDNGTSGGIVSGITILPCYLRHTDASQVITDREIFNDYNHFLDALFNNNKIDENTKSKLIDLLGNNFNVSKHNGIYIFNVVHNFKFMENLINSCIDNNIIEHQIMKY